MVVYDTAINCCVLVCQPIGIGYPICRCRAGDFDLLIITKWRCRHWPSCLFAPALFIGVPIGIGNEIRHSTANDCSHSDLLQTLPTFVYLIPLIFYFLSLSQTYGIAIILYAIVPALGSLIWVSGSSIEMSSKPQTLWHECHTKTYAC